MVRDLWCISHSACSVARVLGFVSDINGMTEEDA